MNANEQQFAVGQQVRLIHVSPAVRGYVAFAAHNFLATVTAYAPHNKLYTVCAGDKFTFAYADELAPITEPVVPRNKHFGWVFNGKVSIRNGHRHKHKDYDMRKVSAASAKRLQRLLNSDAIEKHVEFSDELLTPTIYFWL